MKTEVYSWRLSRELKSDLEREARLRKVSVSSVLETAVRDWLRKSNADVPDDQAQRKLHTGSHELEKRAKLRVQDRPAVLTELFRYNRRCRTADC